MPVATRFDLSSLRRKLGAAAFAGLITTAGLTFLLLLIAWSASDVVQTARLYQDRVHVFSRLHSAASDYQSASYNRVRDPGAVADAGHEETRERLEALIAEVARLPALTHRDRVVAQRVTEQAKAVLELYRDATPLVRRVDAAWRESGSRAALLEVNRVTVPIFTLEATLREEVRRGDLAVASGTARAAGLIRIAVAGALVGLLLAVGFSLIVHLLLHMRLRPGLRLLEQGAQAFGAGDLNHRIGLKGRDELNRLSNAFDTMAQTIAEKQASLKEVQRGLERAVAARTQQLQQANAKLSAADERRRAFLADVSHELRTPLTVIRGEAQVALRTADRQGFDAHDSFERILQQTRDLSRMVDDLFLIARAEAGGLPLDRKLLDVKVLASRVAGDFETLVRETGSSIRAIGESGQFAFVDSDRLRRALTSLIENALRHCQPGVRIEIEVWSLGNMVNLAVTDNGPGIDPALTQQLFERFRRGETRGEGSGLGLSLVGALVEAHGGRTWLEPRKGGGTRAIMQFPGSAASQVAA